MKLFMDTEPQNRPISAGIMIEYVIRSSDPAGQSEGVTELHLRNAWASLHYLTGRAAGGGVATIEIDARFATIAHCLESKVVGQAQIASAYAAIAFLVGAAERQL